MPSIGSVSSSGSIKNVTPKSVDYFSVLNPQKWTSGDILGLAVDNSLLPLDGVIEISLDCDVSQI